MLLVAGRYDFLVVGKFAVDHLGHEANATEAEAHLIVEYLNETGSSVSAEQLG